MNAMPVIVSTSRLFGMLIKSWAVASDATRDHLLSQPRHCLAQPRHGTCSLTDKHLGKNCTGSLFKVLKLRVDYGTCMLQNSEIRYMRLVRARRSDQSMLAAPVRQSRPPLEGRMLPVEILDFFVGEPCQLLLYIALGAFLVVALHPQEGQDGDDQYGRRGSEIEPVANVIIRSVIPKETPGLKGVKAS